MIEGEIIKPIGLGVMLGLTIIDNFFHIDQLFMVFVFTSILVYIGSVNSAKVFKATNPEDIETMKQKDAWLFPVFGGAVLVGLFFIFKFLNKDYVNILFHIYFSFIGAYSIGCIIAEKIGDYPKFKKYGETKLFTVPKIPVINDKPVPVSQLEALCFLPGSVFGLLYFFKKNWMMNNLFGCTFSIFGIENMMLGQYKIGLLLLTLLFFYDVFFVFFTPVMVGVAKNLDGPIKLMFPKVLNYSQPSDFNLIGLGDIVIPGIYVALMLRFDIVKFIRKNGKGKKIPFNFANFKYFIVTLIGYILGIFVTLSIMVIFKHAQPALLYLVPGTLISSTMCAIVSGDFKELLGFNEEEVQKEFKEAAETKEKKSE